MTEFSRAEYNHPYLPLNSIFLTLVLILLEIQQQHNIFWEMNSQSSGSGFLAASPPSHPDHGNMPKSVAKKRRKETVGGNDKLQQLRKVLFLCLQCPQ